MLKVKRGHLQNYLLPAFGSSKLLYISLKDFEDWRNKLDLSNSTKNGITSTFNVILKEALRDEYIEKNPIENVERLSKHTGHSRDILTLDEFKKLFPVDIEEGVKIWKEQKYFTLLFLMVSSGMRSGEIRALKWSDVFWEDSSIMITKAVKNSGKIGSVKEKKDKFVRLPERAIYYLECWKNESPSLERPQYTRSVNRV